MKVGIFIKNYAVGEKFDKSGVPNKSGAEFHAENHAKLFLEHGDSAYIMTKKNNWLTKKREIVNGVDVVRLHAPFRWLESIARLFTTHRHTDCLYILGTPKFSVWAILLFRYIHRPSTLVLTSSSEIFMKNSSWRNKIFSECTNYIAISKEIAQGLEKKGGVSKDKIHILPQGVDTVNRFFPINDAQKKELRVKYNLPEGKKILLFCARIVPNKGIKVMLKTWDIVHQAQPDAILLVVGGGMYSLINEIKEYNKLVDNTIILTGEVDKPDDYYKMADLYFFPSEFEGLPTTLMEAISSGLPCIASKIGGNIDLVQPSESGLLINKYDFQEFAKAILTLFNNDKLREKFSKCGRSYAIEHFDCHKIFYDLRNIIKS